MFSAIKFPAFYIFWEERYRSVLVEGAASTLATVAAYVDLNPVRAGIVENPEDYPWSGYAEACGGGKLARQGLLSILGRGAAGATTPAPAPAPAAEGPSAGEAGANPGAVLGSEAFVDTIFEVFREYFGEK